MNPAPSQSSPQISTSATTSETTQTRLYPCHHCGYLLNQSPARCPECGGFALREQSEREQRSASDARAVCLFAVVAIFSMIQGTLVLAQVDRVSGGSMTTLLVALGLSIPVAAALLALLSPAPQTRPNATLDRSAHVIMQSLWFVLLWIGHLVCMALLLFVLAVLLF